MAMSKAEFAQIKKIVEMAANNPNDAEAIAAFRRATTIFARHNYTWSQVLDRVVSVVDLGSLADSGQLDEPIRDHLGERQHVRDPDLERDFDLAMGSSSGDFLGVLESIYDQYQEKGWVSDRQRTVVRNTAERAAERHAGGRVK